MLWDLKVLWKSYYRTIVSVLKDRWELGEAVIVSLDDDFRKLCNVNQIYFHVTTPSTSIMN